jgi:Rps23 Pro-64 3,4-dihydroxylase Tpa1-like proline 4-hydroxylase
MTWLRELDPQTALLDPTIQHGKADGLHASYSSAKPFPHVVIDNFLPDSVAERCLREFPMESSAVLREHRHQARNRRIFAPDQLPAFSRQLFYTFNSAPFLGILENLTGIKGLIPDPFFHGGGLHEIGHGGHLSIHVDFVHHRALNLERRLNLLVYLNKDWDDDCGGQLELWDGNMRHCVQSITPVFNRCVILKSSFDTNHGNPRPVDHPFMQPRRSMALYYYTATWNPLFRSLGAQYKVRPGSDDRVVPLRGARALVAGTLPTFALNWLRPVWQRCLS